MQKMNPAFKSPFVVIEHDANSKSPSSSNGDNDDRGSHAVADIDRLDKHIVDDNTRELRETLENEDEDKDTFRHRSIAPVDEEYEMGTPTSETEPGNQHPKPKSQGVPPELRNFASEVIMILVCSAGLMFFSFFLGDVLVPQEQIKQALGLNNSNLSWLVGSFNVANGISVIVSGCLSDLMPPKLLMVGAFAWLTVWNIVLAFSLHPSLSVLFFVGRAMQGLAIGVLVSGSMSILGRVYKPGLRKVWTRNPLLIQ